MADKKKYATYETAQVLKEMGFPQEMDGHSFYYMTTERIFINKSTWT